MTSGRTRQQLHTRDLHQAEHRHWYENGMDDFKKIDTVPVFGEPRVDTAEPSWSPTATADRSPYCWLSFAGPPPAHNRSWRGLRSGATVVERLTVSDVKGSLVKCLDARSRNMRMSWTCFRVATDRTSILTGRRLQPAPIDCVCDTRRLALHFRTGTARRYHSQPAKKSARAP